MPQHPFPDPGPDHEEPDRSPLPPAAEGDGAAEQGLYLCLPPEQLTLAGFAQNGEADTMVPGPLLATVVDTVAGPDGQGLAGCSDEFAPVELSYELHLTPQSAAEQMQYSAAVVARLPATFAALGAGQIHPVHLRIIEDETRILSDEDAAKADAFLAEAAPGMTFGELRSAAHKLVLKLDPEAVRKRKEAAKRETHVRRFREESGNAGLVARELPSAEVLASWQHVEQRALDLRAAGMPGSLQELRVQAYLDLLQERDSRDQLASPSPPPVPSSPIKTVASTIPARPARMTLPTVAARAVPVPVPGQARLSGRASRRWSRSPSPWPPTRAGPRPRVKPTGSACWTATRLAAWPPPRPAIPAPDGASPP